MRQRELQGHRPDPRPEERHCHGDRAPSGSRPSWSDSAPTSRRAQQAMGRVGPAADRCSSKPTEQQVQLSSSEDDARARDVRRC